MTSSETDEILVVEHDPAVAELIRRYLAKEGLQVRTARTPAETVAALTGAAAAAVVLDLTMPGLDARQIRRLIRRGPASPAGPGRQPRSRRGRSQPTIGPPGADAPVICLTAGGGPHPVQGLRPRDIGVGLDACLSRPFGPRTLVARVRAAVASAAGRLLIDPAHCRVMLDGTQISLTATECDLLTCLVNGAGRVIPRAALRAAVWGEDVPDGTRIVDVYIGQLRAKLGPGHGIRTVRGTGYVLDTGMAAGGPRGSGTTLNQGGKMAGKMAPATIGGAGDPTRGDSGTA